MSIFLGQKEASEELDLDLEDLAAAKKNGAGNKKKGQPKKNSRAAAAKAEAAISEAAKKEIEDSIKAEAQENNGMNFNHQMPNNQYLGQPNFGMPPGGMMPPGGQLPPMYPQNPPPYPYNPYYPQGPPPDMSQQPFTNGMGYPNPNNQYFQQYPGYNQDQIQPHNGQHHQPLQMLQNHVDQQSMMPNMLHMQQPGQQAPHQNQQHPLHQNPEHPLQQHPMQPQMPQQPPDHNQVQQPEQGPPNNQPVSNGDHATNGNGSETPKKHVIYPSNKNGANSPTKQMVYPTEPIKEDTRKDEINYDWVSKFDSRSRPRHDPDRENCDHDLDRDLDQI